MTTLSGKVAILNDAGEVVGVKDLGPTSVEIKPAFVKPLVEIKPALLPGEALVGPTYQVNADNVVATYTKKDAATVDAEGKDSAVTSIEGDRQVLLKCLLLLENDNRAIKAKINALLTEISATTPKFPAGQAAQITMDQMKTAIRNLL